MVSHPQDSEKPTFITTLRSRYTNWREGPVQEIEINSVSPNPPANTPNTTQHTHSSSLSRSSSSSSAKESSNTRNMSGSIEIDPHPGTLLTPPPSAHSHIRRPALRTPRSGSSSNANHFNQHQHGALAAPSDSRDYLVKDDDDEEDYDDDEVLDIGLFMRDRPPRERQVAAGEREGYFGRVLLVEELRREREYGHKGHMV